MPRPYKDHTTQKLAELLSAHPADRALLEALRAELVHRRRPGAAKLAEAVDEALTRVSRTAAPIVASARRSSRARTDEQSTQSMPRRNPAAAPVTQPSLAATEPPASVVAAPKTETVRQVPAPVPFPPVTDRPASVLDAWTALEVLNPPTFKHPKDLASGDPTLVSPFGGDALPWERPVPGRPNMKTYFHLVLGTVNALEAFAALLRAFSDSRPDAPSVRGQACIASIVLTKAGIPVSNAPVTVSSFAWALPEALDGNLARLADWPNVAPALEKGVLSRLNRHDANGNPLPITQAQLDDAYAWLVTQMRLPTALCAAPSFAIRAFVPFKSSTPPEPLLLNSFYLADLAGARTMVAAGRTPVALSLFLGESSPPARRDALRDAMVWNDAVAPRHVPPGRWPAPGRAPLVLLQQTAVNLALRDLRERGLLAVNGPPGTGKTTLLRDVVAAVVTERAEVMCRFTHPAQAFQNTGAKLPAGQGWLHLHSLDASVRGHEILVASSNNRAVENVSAELPGLEAVGSHIPLTYFQPTAEALLGRPSWGLIAAVLGNASNRATFRAKFWWDSEVGLSSYFAEAAGIPQWLPAAATDGTTTQRRPRIVVEADAPASPAEAQQRWSVARERFAAARQRVAAARQYLEAVREHLAVLPELECARTTALSAVSTAHELEAAARSAAQQATCEHEAAQMALLETQHDVERHAADRPAWWVQLLYLAPVRAWRAERKIRTANLESARQQESQASRLLQQRTEAMNAAAAALRDANQALQAADDRLTKAHNFLTAARREFGPHVVDEQFVNQPPRALHQSVPWCHDQLNRLREELFAEAMTVHKAFVDAAAKPIRHNLGALMKVLAGNGSLPSGKEQWLGDLWSTLFLVVPVLSTTFASVERMLGPLPAESLGWLLIDEAGQASPQQAVGALMRSRRAIVVGDPVQIEPVVTLPSSLTTTLCRRFGVDPDQFNAPVASVQTLADSGTAYFSEFPTLEGSRTVGVPLLVHRRCADPMFSTANCIAYANQMVKAKAEKTSAIRDCLGTSAWFHVEGTSDDKWCAAEGNAVLGLLRRLVAAGVPLNLYLITPFVVVMERLRTLVINSGLVGGPTQARAWAQNHIGTVHTFQGREAEAVVMVLGAPMAEQRGARDWAGSSPNLLNVALTRAKESFYVIGNRDLWKQVRHFDVLAQEWPIVD